MNCGLPGFVFNRLADKNVMRMQPLKIDYKVSESFAEFLTGSYGMCQIS